MPLPSMPTVRKMRRSILSPKCPAKNMPTAYADRNARSTWPNSDCRGVVGEQKQQQRSQETQDRCQRW